MAPELWVADPWFSSLRPKYVSLTITMPTCLWVEVLLTAVLQPWNRSCDYRSREGQRKENPGRGSPARGLFPKIYPSATVLLHLNPLHEGNSARRKKSVTMATKDTRLIAFSCHGGGCSVSSPVLILQVENCRCSH